MARSKVASRQRVQMPVVMPPTNANALRRQAEANAGANAEEARAMFAEWEAEDALLDPVQAEADWEDFKAAMNAGRPPEYPIYPSGSTGHRYHQR